jgi:1,4-dihydroxy-2-naphthoate octaprenyltransferase
VSGNDQRATASDRTLFDLGLKPRQVLAFSLALFAVAVAIGGYVVLAWGGALDLLLLFAVGALLAFFYTAEPVRLKARALGDLTILLCYGPLPVLGVFFMQTGRWEWLVPTLLSLSPGLLAVAILHANNTRDLDKDRRARTLTIAHLLGTVDNCRRFYVALIALAYLAILVVDLLPLALTGHIGSPAAGGGFVGGSVLLVVLPLVALPIAVGLVRQFQEGLRKDTLVEQTAQFHLAFGVLMLVGLLCHTYF